MIAEKRAEISVNPLKVKQDRAEAIDLTIGYLDVEKGFFMGKNNDDNYNYTLFLMPFSLETWLVLIATIVVTGITLQYP